jgi:hypothetical protein
MQSVSNGKRRHVGVPSGKMDNKIKKLGSGKTFSSEYV